jgi:mRNA-degrading endonuclease RelE of RelBE toxin-antitoxin system
MKMRQTIMRNEPQRAQRTQRKKERRSQENLAQPHKEMVLAKKIARCLQQLEQTPRQHPNVKALKGDYAGYYPYRIGDYRVINQFKKNPDGFKKSGNLFII